MKEKYSLDFYVCGSYPGLFNPEIWNHPTAELADYYLLISLLPGFSSSHSFTYNSIYKERSFPAQIDQSTQPTANNTAKHQTIHLFNYSLWKTQRSYQLPLHWYWGCKTWWRSPLLDASHKPAGCTFFTSSISSTLIALSTFSASST